MFSTIIAFLGGVLAASGSIIKKKPNAAELIDKVAPYQGFIGLVILFWGISSLFTSLTSMSLLSVAPVSWIIMLITAIATFIVGFLLSFSLLSKYLFSKNETALAKGQSLRGKLINYQVPAGYLLIVMAILSLLVRFRIL